MKKRSQMEIMGIAIVVIILTIVILFVVRWGVMKEPVEYKKEFAQSEIASNLVHTMLSTTTECKGMTFDELFQDCFEGPTINDCPGSLTSCLYSQGQVSQIFSRTLDTWNYKYEFTVFKGNNPPVISLGTCGDIKERKAKSYPLAGGLEAMLAICG